MRTLLVLSLLLLAACGSESVSSSGPPASSPTDSADSLAAGGGISRADNDLLIEIDRGDGSAPERWSLTCVGFVEGDHPRAEEACEHLKAMDDPFAPIPDDAICTQIYGGPETAHVTGLWRGEPVDLQLSRSDGCRIDQWERLGPLLAPA
jgi:hypothetical protein